MAESEQTNQEVAKWRDKYLDALDTQEQQEKAHQDDLQLLSKALIRVSLAAQGQYPQLDKNLESLRQNLRAGNTHRIEQQLQTLEQTLLELDRLRDTSADTQSQSVRAMATQLLALAPERTVKKQLRELSQTAVRQRGKLDLFPQLLQQLEQLQQQVLAIQPSRNGANGGFMARLRGRPSVPAAPAAMGGDTDHAAHNSEPVGDSLRDIINELLLSVEAQAVEPERVSALQSKLRLGISNAQLLPTLAEVRDLVLTAYMAASRAFAGYLTEVNQQLADIYHVIEGAVHHSGDLRQASDQIQQQMLHEFSQLEDQTTRAENLDELKHQVQSRLGNIRAALHEHQHLSGDKHPVTEQLSQLATRVRQMEQEASRSRKVLEEQRAKALTDPLTGIPNREAYRERVQLELLRFQRYATPLTLAVCDLDLFKNINDSLGHQAGDRVLEVLSRAMAKQLREVDFFGRYGGEEFVVVMPQTTAQQAFVVLDRIRAAIANTDFSYKETPVELTVSIGIAEFIAAANETAEEVFSRADKALYDAKAQGRNVCVVAEAKA